MKKTLTVFTPTYNRSYCLHNCYESLCRQTSKDFKWLIIDDGSIDNTKDLIDKWKNENKIEIEYFYKPNGGMHTAHNAAYQLIDTELNVCIDSDDYMTDDAVEKIINFWNQNGSSEYAGIIALDGLDDGSVLGTKFPEDRKSITHTGFHNAGVIGDKKLVYRTEIVKKYPPYPVFEGENYVGLTYLSMLIDEDYELLILNEILCIVERQADGSTNNMIESYKKNPRGFIEFRKVAMTHSPNYKRKFIECVHYVSSNIMLKDRNFLGKSPCKFTTLIATPFGTLLYLYINNTKKKTTFKGDK